MSPSGRNPSAGPAAPPVSAPAPRVTISHVHAADGSVVAVAAFRGPVRYVLHNGSDDPGPGAAGLVSAGPVIGRAERHRLIAAFNGGFKLSAGPAATNRRAT
ncbi:MAG: hypothetical protein JOY82_01940 [Streptosporangiaceae bacterium]|nr:hypothetical protein [Streptosporangiaceae bacterium]MBV9853273.1 hypothetical protein [Streptosporangiaceae bacterium]